CTGYLIIVRTSAYTNDTPIASAMPIKMSCPRSAPLLDIRREYDTKEPRAQARDESSRSLISPQARTQSIVHSAPPSHIRNPHTPRVHYVPGQPLQQRTTSLLIQPPPTSQSSQAATSDPYAIASHDRT